MPSPGAAMLTYVLKRLGSGVLIFLSVLAAVLICAVVVLLFAANLTDAHFGTAFVIVTQIATVSSLTSLTPGLPRGQSTCCPIRCIPAEPGLGIAVTNSYPRTPGGSGPEKAFAAGVLDCVMFLGAWPHNSPDC